MNDFYVYRHINPHTDDVFYIGKGRGNRLRQKDGRNTHWQRYVAKYGYKAEIVLDGLTESEALIFEQEEIARIGLARLTNMTAGGETGVSPEKRIERDRQDILAGLKLTGLLGAAWVYESPSGDIVQEYLS